MAEARENPRESETPASRREASRASPAGGSPASKREAARAAPGAETEQLVLTLSGATGEIVKVEKLEEAGQRHELSPEEYAELAVDDETDELEAALEEAYDAGVADALGEDDEEGAGDEELALRRLAVGRLLVRGKLRRGLRRRLLRRAIRREALMRGLLRRELLR